VVITGVGAVTPIGIGATAFWDALSKGNSGVGTISLFDVSGFRSQKAAEVKSLEGVKLPGRTEHWNGSRSVSFALAAAKLALEDAAIEVNDTNRPGIGVAFGTTLACLNLMARFDQQSLRESPRSCDPGMFPDTGVSAPACRVSIALGARAFNATLSNGQTSSLDALNYAVRFIRAGRAHTVLTGGVEELCLESFLGYYKRGLLAGSRNGDRELCCPFDRRRSGVVLGEGSAVFVLEEYEHARARGARMRAEFLGYGSAFEPRSEGGGGVRPLGACRAMAAALGEASVRPEQIDFVFCNANSSTWGDLAEARAMTRVFGKQAKPYVSALKSVLGEAYSAGGSMQVAASALALHHGIIPPTINCDEPDPHCRVGTLVTAACQADAKFAMVNSLGCNGNNASVVLKSIDGA
jgi:3-oxoacyl-[acyl-carrier-protein] synthase II